MSSPSPLSRSEICRLLSEYESGHAVEAYTTDFRWNAWPIVRYSTAKRLHRPQRDDSAARALRRARRPRGETLRKSTQVLQSLVDRRRGANRPDVRSARDAADVFIVTQSNRRETISGTVTHYLAEPLAHELQARGLSVRVLETGEPKPPRHANHRWIEALLAGEWKWHRMRTGGSTSPVPPHWFSEYVDWFSRYSDWTGLRLKREFEWSSHEEQIRHVEVLSRAFERWFRRAGCRLLIVDCWVTCQAMGAILAARRLGIHSVEIQHGLISANNYMYTHWNRVPPGGFELMPDTLWLWGTQTAETVVRTNQFEPRHIVGGSPWLNWWRCAARDECRLEVERARALTVGCELSVLYTAQPHVEADSLCRAIQAAPRTWKWLVRLHRSDDAHSSRTREQVEQLRLPNVAVHEAREIPLYALFKAVDVHVTGFSTCAQEALAFGLPTVLIDANGRDVFARELADGCMQFAHDDADLLRLLPRARDIPAAQCLQMSEALYASEEDYSKAIDALEHLVEIGTYRPACRNAAVVST